GSITGVSTSFSGLSTFTATPTGTTVGQGSLLINPASASAGQTLFGIALGGTDKLRVDDSGNLIASGDVSSGGLVSGLTAGFSTSTAGNVINVTQSGAGRGL